MIYEVVWNAHCGGHFRTINESYRRAIVLLDVNGVEVPEPGILVTDLLREDGPYPSEGE